MGIVMNFRKGTGQRQRRLPFRGLLSITLHNAHYAIFMMTADASGHGTPLAIHSGNAARCHHRPRHAPHAPESAPAWSAHRRSDSICGGFFTRKVGTGIALWRLALAILPFQHQMKE